jgi:hypothetical protein
MTDAVAAAVPTAETATFADILSGIQTKARKSELEKLAFTYVEVQRIEREVAQVLSEIKRIGETDALAEDVAAILTRANRLLGKIR